MESGILKPTWMPIASAPPGDLLDFSLKLMSSKNIMWMGGRWVGLFVMGGLDEWDSLPFSHCCFVVSLATIAEFPCLPPNFKLETSLLNLCLQVTGELNELLLSTSWGIFYTSKPLSDQTVTFPSACL